MRFLTFIFLFFPFIVIGQDSLPTICFIFDNGDVVEKEITLKTDKYGVKRSFINELTKNQIETLDSIYVKGFTIEYFDYSVAFCGYDAEGWKRTFIDDRFKTLLQTDGKCKEVGLSLKLVKNATSEVVYISEFHIYNYRLNK